MSALQLVADEAIKWAVPALGGLFLTVVTVKHRAIMDWRRTREARNQSLDALLATWPTVMRQIGEANESAGRTTEQFTALHGRLDTQDQALADLLALNYGSFELSPAATFVCDNAGRNLMVNSAYARLLHTGRDELMDFGYRRFIKSSEVAAYLARFKGAAEEHREFECDLCMVRADGSEVRARVRMVPHPRNKGPATHWIGTLLPVEGEC